MRLGERLPEALGQAILEVRHLDFLIGSPQLHLLGFVVDCWAQINVVLRLFQLNTAGYLIGIVDFCL